MHTYTYSIVHKYTHRVDESEGIKAVVSTYHFIEAFEVIGDNLRLWSINKAGLLVPVHFGVLVVALVVPMAVHFVLSGNFAVDLSLHLHQHWREHAKLGAATRDLQQTEDNVTLVFPHYQIVRLE